MCYSPWKWLRWVKIGSNEYKKHINHIWPSGACAIAHGHHREIQNYIRKRTSLGHEYCYSLSIVCAMAHQNDMDRWKLDQMKLTKKHTNDIWSSRACARAHGHLRQAQNYIGERASLGHEYCYSLSIGCAIAHENGLDGLKFDRVKITKETHNSYLPLEGMCYSPRTR